MDTEKGERRKKNNEKSRAQGDQVVGGRPSKAPSQDRRGKVYTDNYPFQTIRAITPETPPTSAGSAAGSGVPISPSPISPPPKAQNRSDAPDRHTDTPASVSNTDDETKVEKRLRKSRAKPRRLDDTAMESSPSSFISKTRQRLGSITTSGAFTTKPVEESAGSIGFPSVIPSPTLTNQNASSQLPLFPPNRATSPVGADAMFGSLQSTLMDPDTKKISALMKTTSGRMAGILFFRTSPTASWASGYCAINVSSSSLIYQPNVRIPANSKTLIPDLRGSQVRTLFDAESQSTYLKVSITRSDLEVQLRPAVPETFDSWLAALLCWQPLFHRQSTSHSATPQKLPLGDAVKPGNVAEESHASRSATTIKVGKALRWANTPAATTSRPSILQRISSHKQTTETVSRWHQVNCILQDNGLLRLSAESASTLISVVHLSKLSRSAIQHLDSSLLDEEFCVAIYPQFTVSAALQHQSNPIFLAFETRVLFEVWFVLLRAFTVPAIFGVPSPSWKLSGYEDSPKQRSSKVSSSGMFRIARSVTVRLVDSRIRPTPEADRSAAKKHNARVSSLSTLPTTDIYAEFVIDGVPKARTAVKTDLGNAIWGEDFRVVDLGRAPSSIAVVLKIQNPAEQEWTLTTPEQYDLSQEDNRPPAIGGEIEVSSHDAIYGRVDIQHGDIGAERDSERRYPIIDNKNNPVGDMLIKANVEEQVVLMGKDYAPLAKLLHNFSNGLTLRLARELHTELITLSEILVDILQVSGGITEWLYILVEDEIDSIQRELPPRRFRFSHRMQSNDFTDTGEDRELVLRDLSRSATVEANLLFRGNSLLTKALDAHMRRLGKEYLEETIGDKLREIADQNPDCEVDPAKLDPQADTDRNWQILMSLTRTIWHCIATSAEQCPVDLRLVFRHIQSCAQDRYGDFIRSVRYSSVSGFLFLRFFCPAILNPQLFGLLKDHPRVRARRTLTLITKSLQVLGNMTTFGYKEPWMEPMNKFILASRGEFKLFIDQICAVPSRLPSKAVPPSYATPTQILSRLPETSREGFPSLPYLIDSAKCYSTLITLWLKSGPKDNLIDEADQSLSDFHSHAVELSRRTRECVEKVQHAQLERPNSKTTFGSPSPSVHRRFGSTSNSSPIPSLMPAIGKRITSWPSSGAADHAVKGNMPKDPEPVRHAIRSESHGSIDSTGPASSGPVPHRPRPN